MQIAWLAELPFQTGWFIGRAFGLPVVFLGFIAYALTAFSRKFKTRVKSVIRLLLSVGFMIAAFLFSLFTLEAAKDVDYDLTQLVPAPLSAAVSAGCSSLSASAARPVAVAVAALGVVEQHAALISKAMVAVVLAPLFTYGVRSFLRTLRWLLCCPPNFVHGLCCGLVGSFEYIACAVSLRNHSKHPQW